MMPKSLVALAVTVLCTSLGLIGCDVDPSIAPVLSPSDSLFWNLRINFPAVRISLRAPYDTVQLDAVPYSAANTMMDTLTTPSTPTIWYSTDSTRVRVTPTGMVSARGVTGTQKVYVVAKRRVGGVTREDRAMIQVVDVADPPVLASFRSRPADSLKRANGSTFIMVTQLKDRDSVPLVGYPVHYRSSNPIAASIRDPWIVAITAGHPFYSNTMGTSQITASTMAFGVALVDTFTVEVGYRINPTLEIPRVEIRSMNGVATPILLFPTIEIGPSGVAAFTNNTGITVAQANSTNGLTASNGTVISYVFDDSLRVKAAVGAQYTPTDDGNIAAISGDTLTAWANKKQFRMFPFPGRYEYTVQPFGLRGVVIVHDR